MQVLGKIFSRSAAQPLSRSAAQPLSRSATLTSIAFALLTACTAAAIGSTGYSLVFKGCSAANVAEYYDKTECVRDNATGLIWQGQMPAGTGLRANDNLYTSFDSTNGMQGTTQDLNTFLFTEKPATKAQIDAPNNYLAFINTINASNLCGANTWRMPNHIELRSIYTIIGSGNFLRHLDSTWFPNTTDNYVASSSTCPGFSRDAGVYANAVNCHLRSEPNGVRLVR